MIVVKGKMCYYIIISYKGDFNAEDYKRTKPK